MIDRGEVVELFDIRLDSPPHAYYVVYEQGAKMRPEVRLFVDWLMATSNGLERFGRIATDARRWIIQQRKCRQCTGAGLFEQRHLLFFFDALALLDLGRGLVSVTMHMSRIDVQDGETVGQGQLLGLSGATGRE